MTTPEASGIEELISETQFMNIVVAFGMQRAQGDEVCKSWERFVTHTKKLYAAIDAQQAEIARLRTALSPFATIAHSFKHGIDRLVGPYEDEHELTVDHNKTPYHSMLTVGDLRRAAAALSPDEAEEGRERK